MASGPRIVVVGTSGSGKSTLAARLAARLDMPFIEQDAINWQAGWVPLAETDPEEFRRRVVAAIAPDRWAFAGNYSKTRAEVWGRATHLVWLDYPRPVIMGRVIRRSLHRAISGEELWEGTGNREDFRRWLDKTHPIRWAWDTFQHKREQTAELLATPMAAHLHVAHLRRPVEAERLVEAGFFG